MFTGHYSDGSAFLKMIFVNYLFKKLNFYGNQAPVHLVVSLVTEDYGKSRYVVLVKFYTHVALFLIFILLFNF